MIMYRIAKCNLGVSHYKNKSVHRVNDRFSNSYGANLYILSYRLNWNLHRENGAESHGRERYHFNKK